MTVLSLDLGSTRFKAAVYDRDLHQQASSDVYLPYLRRDEEVLLDPEEVLRTVRRAVEGALGGGNGGFSPDAVALTSQAQTFALRRNGRFETPFISWQDRRGGEAAARLARDPALAGFPQHACTARPLPAMMIALIEGMEPRVPPEDRVEILPLSAYVLEALTGTPRLDVQLAEMSGFWSIPGQCWHEPFLRRCGLVSAQLPDVIGTGQSAGVSVECCCVGLPAGRPVYSCGNDQTAAALGVGLERESDLLLTLGSAHVLYQRRTAFPPADGSMIRGRYPGGGFYRLHAREGGHRISRVLHQLGLGGYPDFFALAEEGLTSASPGPAASLCGGTLLELTRELKAACRAFAGAEGIGRCYLAEEGGARNAFWRGLLETELGMRWIPRPASPLRGAARLVPDAESIQP